MLFINSHPPKPKPESKFAANEFHTAYVRKLASLPHYPSLLFDLAKTMS